MNAISIESIEQFLAHLLSEERCRATVEKYSHALRQFYAWLPEDKTVSKAAVIGYKAALAERYAPSSANGILAALNGFFKFQNRHDCVVKQFRIQRRAFSPCGKELTQKEYRRLVDAARQCGKTRLSLLLQLIASTGMRVSEVQYVTVEAAGRGQVEIHLKGKVRAILLPEKLCQRLLRYCRAQKIASGAIFRSKSGRVINRKDIWAQMKRLCETAGVSPEKVFPHNLRHLFARVFYSAQKDIAKLADLLGHSSVETTRIYLLSSGTEHKRALEKLGMVC